MIPGEYFFNDDDIDLNANRPTATLEVNNTGDRPVQVGSHYHFFEVNRALRFDRARAYGMRLDIPAGTAVRFEPGEVKSVRLVTLAGERRVYGGSGLVMGAVDDERIKRASMERLKGFQAGELPLNALKSNSAAAPREARKSKKRVTRGNKRRS